MSKKDAKLLVHYELELLIDKAVGDSCKRLVRELRCVSPEDYTYLRDVLSKVFLLGLAQGEKWEQVKEKLYSERS